MHNENIWWEKDEWLRNKLTNDPVIIGIFKRVRSLQRYPEEEELLFWREIAKFKTDEAQRYFDEVVNMRICTVRPEPICIPEGGKQEKKEAELKTPPEKLAPTDPVMVMEITEEDLVEDCACLIRNLEETARGFPVRFTLEGLSTVFHICRGGNTPQGRRSKGYSILDTDSMSMVLVRDAETLTQILKDSMTIGITPYKIMFPYARYIIPCTSCGSHIFSNKDPGENKTVSCPKCEKEITCKHVVDTARYTEEEYK
jgi:hypothetical protein